jgi:flagellar basal-body rod protein FlgB
LRQERFKPAAYGGYHGRGRRTGSRTKPADFKVKAGQIKRMTPGNFCLGQDQAFPHGRDGSKHYFALPIGRYLHVFFKFPDHGPIQAHWWKKTVSKNCKSTFFNAFWPVLCKEDCMDPTKTGPIALSEQRLRWLEARQRVLSQNIANADTPNYRPSDMQSFGKVLSRNLAEQTLRTTSSNHLPATRHVDARVVKEARSANRDPSGNAVSLEREAMRVAETDSAHAAALSVRRRYMSMFMTALGRPQQ